MSDRIDLDRDEVIFLMCERVQYGNMHAGFGSTLALTNKNLVLIKKGFFGATKETIRFPLEDIKIYNGEPQVSVRRASSGYPVLDVFFTSGQESFYFELKLTAVKWAEKITEVVTGAKATPSKATRYIIPGTEIIAKTLKGTIDTYKDALGITKKEEHVSCQCPACCASVEGVKGETVQCPYCRTYITLN